MSGCVCVDSFQEVTLLRKLKLCLLAGPDTSDSSSFLWRERQRQRGGFVVFPHTFPCIAFCFSKTHKTCDMCRIKLPVCTKANASCTFWRLGHRRLQAVHVVSSVAVITEQQLVLHGRHTVLNVSYNMCMGLKNSHYPQLGKSINIEISKTEWKMLLGLMKIFTMFFFFHSDIGAVCHKKAKQ